MREFLFQILLFLLSAIIGIVAQMLPRRGERQAVLILGLFFGAVSVLWAGYEIGAREALTTPVASEPPTTLPPTNEPAWSLAPEHTQVLLETPATIPASLPPGVTSTRIAAPTHLPDTQLASTAVPTFGEVSFCLDDDLDGIGRHCRTSQEVFTRPVTRINASWTHHNVYRGMVFSRKWYWENQLIWQVRDDVWDEEWEITGGSECTYLDVSGGYVFPGESVFRTGSYTLELYVGDKLEQVGHFVILR